jgi:outer membrane PBP1 activator LpoA protein
MDGIVFCDLPWVIGNSPADRGLRDTLEQLSPGITERYGRLFALGMDAFELIPYLQHPGPGVSGHTGWLELDPDRRIHRTLVWAQIRDGSPELVTPSVPAQSAP